MTETAAKQRFLWHFTRKYMDYLCRLCRFCVCVTCYLCYQWYPYIPLRVTRVTQALYVTCVVPILWRQQALQPQGGHFLCLRSIGLPAEEFAIGFGPQAIGVSWIVERRRDCLMMFNVFMMSYDVLWCLLMSCVFSYSYVSIYEGMR